MNIDMEARYNISLLAGKLAEGKREEARLLDALSKDAEYSPAKKLENDAIRIAGLSERNFLEGKRITAIASKKKDVTTYDFTDMGTTEHFPCTLSLESGIWKFFLPPCSSVSIGKRGSDIGRYSGYLVKNLISNYESSYGKIDAIKEPVIVFEFGFPEAETLTKLFDADNRDTKRIIDAMTGTFYPDDNILSVRTLHYGTLSARPCTVVYVMEKALFPIFLDENKVW